MRKRTKFAVGAGAALAVAGTGGAVAATKLSPSQEAAAIVDDAAKQLGGTPERLSDALRQAFAKRIDEAVEDGRLSQDAAEQLRETLEAGELPLVGGPLFKGSGLGRSGFGHALHFGLEAAAGYLGLTEAELRDALRNGQSLADVARAEGKPVGGLVDALVREQTARLDQAVQDGKLTRVRRDEIASRLRDRVERMVEAQPLRGRHGFGPRHPMQEPPNAA